MNLNINRVERPNANTGIRQHPSSNTPLDTYIELHEDDNKEKQASSWIHMVLLGNKQRQSNSGL
ncbi:hypothetical protein [Candidatus Albibeggiatoa sp. nov. NOAA]|uniref:hypothetical protein n=1 Tax=Candidatus Albibeggiatoa sp. nov. NOAA TaxID=3162724 RepID=UPI0032FFEDEC|nr:hypothetical protein [Thiotrichaceae bacterium]